MTIDFVACLATSWVALDTDFFDEDLFLFVGIVRGRCRCRCRCIDFY